MAYDRKVSAVVRLLATDAGAPRGGAGRLGAGSFAIEACRIGADGIAADGIGNPACSPATLLVTLGLSAEAAIAAATGFAEAFPQETGADRLIVHLWHVTAPTDWEASRGAAIMAAFTRHAALTWAGQRVRVNGVTLAAAADGSRVADGEIAATIQALWRWRSMTGQVIHLGG